MNQIEQILEDISSLDLDGTGNANPDKMKEILQRYDSIDLVSENLSAIGEEIKRCKENMLASEEKEKTWKENKSYWKNKENAIKLFLSAVMEKFSQASIKDENMKASINSRRVLEIDEEFILQPYREMLKSMESQLPSFIKCSLNIDKTAFTNHVKDDPRYLIEYPEKIHWKESKTFTLK